MASVTPLDAQNGCCLGDLRLIAANARVQQFEQTVVQYQAERRRERLNVPVYNARLNNAVVGFHRHITKDDHYKHTNCAACRGYLDEIRKYAKKIDKAMK
jgi:hypothetical protein